MDMSKGTNTITIALMRVTQTSDSGMSMFAIHNIGVEGRLAITGFSNQSEPLLILFVSN